MPTILHLDLGGEYRGGQRQVILLAEGLKKSGRYQCVVASTRDAPLLSHADKSGLDKLVLSGGREWSLWSLFKLGRAIREMDVRIVHTHDARAASVAALLRFFSAGKWKLVHTRRVSYAIGRGWSFKKYALADLVVAVSNEIGSKFSRRGLPGERLAVVPSSIRLSRYRSRKSSPSAVGMIGIIGALTEQKGHRVLFEALNLILKREVLPEWKVRVVGDGPLRDQLEQDARDKGLEGNIVFEGYRESRNVLPDLDVLVVPSVDGEGSSGVVREGWAVGLPVIVSDLPSNIELVQHRINGLVVPRGDAGALADALQEMLLDSEFAAALTVMGRKSVARYTDTAMAEAYAELYDRLLNHP